VKRLVLGALTLVAGAPVHAQDTALTRLLIEHRHPVSIANGRLEGGGGRFLVDHGKKSRFVLIGEEHGVAQLPGFVQALVSELRPAGFNTFAIEVSPLQGLRLDSLARSPRMREGLDTLLASWFTTIPFYTLAEERALLTATMSREGAQPPMRIWGLDYDVSADRLFLRELERLVPSAGRSAVARARALADSGFASVVAQGNPTRLFAWSASDSVFEALRAALGSRPSPRARAIVEVFERTARINRLFLSGRGYESNLLRSAYLRENFLTAFRAAEERGTAPRVVFKFGGSHMMRGVNYTHTLDIGTAAVVVAEGRGERAFNLLILGGSKAKTARMNILKLQYEPTGNAEVDLDNVAWLRPALTDSGWVVFDMHAVRLAYLRRRSTPLTPVQDRFLHAYDAIVVLTGSTPGTPMPLAPRD
jgi:erythromycin esterase-like protein